MTLKKGICNYCRKKNLFIIKCIKSYTSKIKKDTLKVIVILFIRKYMPQFHCILSIPLRLHRVMTHNNASCISFYQISEHYSLKESGGFIFISASFLVNSFSNKHIYFHCVLPFPVRQARSGQ